MSFVNTQPAAIAAAATQIEGIANSFAAESSAAASSTTDVAPCSRRRSVGLQAGVFSTYGQLYQSVSAQAQAIHQQFVQLLNQSSGSYQETETANQAGAAANALSNASGSASSAASSAAPIDTLTGLISGLTSMLSGSVLNSNLVNLGNIQVGNFASAGSDLIGMGGGGLLTALAGPSTAGADFGGLGTALAGDFSPAAAAGGAVGGAGGLGAAPVLAAAGTGSSIGPHVGAAQLGRRSRNPGGEHARHAGVSELGPGAPGGMSTGSPGTMAGMPAVANGGRGGSSFGAPRYGVKPKVMPTIPKPTLS